MNALHNRWVCLFAGLIACVPAATAFAAGDGEGPNLFTGDLGNIFWSLLTFVIVLVLLGKFAWGPILGTLQKREDFIRSSLEQAKQDREKAEATLKDYTAKLETARSEATAIVDEGRRDAEVVKHGIEENAKKEADAIIERAKREIGIATDTAVKELYGLTGRLATEVASRVIRKELDASAHEQLISDSLEELTKAS